MASRPPVDLAALSRLERLQFRNKYDVFFFDMDGTLAKMSKERIPGALEAIAALAQHGKEMYVITDNCSSARADVARSVRMDFPMFEQEHVINSTWLVSNHLKKTGFSKKVYVMGVVNGLCKELVQAGFDIVLDEVREMAMEDVLHLELDPEVGAVVLGADINFSYLKLLKAVSYLRDPSVVYLSTHCMVTALFQPVVLGAGALALPIEAMSGRKPTVCGKTGPVSVEFVRSLGFDMRRCIFVGDGLDNDMAFGNLCGMDTLLVLSGTTDIEHVEEARRAGRTHEIPTYFADSIALLQQMFY